MNNFTFTTASTATSGYVVVDPVRIQPAMTLPIKPVPCPLCRSRAITGADGKDVTWSITDFEPEADSKNYRASGTVARMRICSECGHIWATLVKPVEK